MPEDRNSAISEKESMSSKLEAYLMYGLAATALIAGGIMMYTFWKSDRGRVTPPSQIEKAVSEYKLSSEGK